MRKDSKIFVGKTLENAIQHNRSQPVQQVLVVDDDLEMLDYLHSLLAPNYLVTVAKNGKEALELIHQNPIELVISDVSMPIMDGFELLDTVRKHSGSSILPFLILTGRLDQNYKIEALRLGVDMYLTKPFDSDELLARVQNLLTNSALRKQEYLRLFNQTQLEAHEMPAHSNDSFPPNFQIAWLKELESIVKLEIHNQKLKVPDIAYKMAVSERTLRNRIKAYTGLSPNEYLLAAKLDMALRLLEKHSYATVAEVAHAVGISSKSYFSRTFKDRFGKSPSEYYE